jgi:hypothetical protein
MYRVGCEWGHKRLIHATFGLESNDKSRSNWFAGDDVEAIEYHSPPFPICIRIIMRKQYYLTNEQMNVHGCAQMTHHFKR